MLPATSSFAKMPAFNSDDSSDDESSSGALKDKRVEEVLASGRAYSANTSLAGYAGITKAK